MSRGNVSLNDMSVSERIAVLSARFNQAHADKSREQIGKEYGMTGRNIARYVRCNNLIPAFKDMLDDESLTLIAGVELSFLSEEEQGIVLEVLEKNCVSLNKDTAVKLRRNGGFITKGTVHEVFGIDKPVETSDIKVPINVKLSGKVYRRYFSDVAAKDVQGILEEALDLYFQRKGA